nr:hypothetical protein [Saprospiraceae bacterium]
NIVNNAFQACFQQSESLKSESQEMYTPLVTLKTRLNIKDKNSALMSLCEISITDNGPGIPAHIKDKIFQPFFTTKSTRQGTGLGLSLAYDIVKAHGGSIKVESYSSQSGPPDGTISVNSKENEARPPARLNDTFGQAIGRGTEFIIQLPIV